MSAGPVEPDMAPEIDDLETGLHDVPHGVPETLEIAVDGALIALQKMSEWHASLFDADHGPRVWLAHKNRVPWSYVKAAEVLHPAMH